MVIRSVVLKIYLFASVALIAVFLGAFWAGHMLMDRARRDAMHQLSRQHATFLEHLLGQALVAEPTHPGQMRLDPGQLAQIEQGLMVDIRYEPWSATHGHPSQLRSRPLYFPGGSEPWSRYWVRLDHDGAPVGAALIRSRIPHGKPERQPLEFPLLIAGFTGLAIVPPLLLWVTRPLSRMVALAHRLGEGDLDTPVKVSGHDEFGDLERAFESLRGRIGQMLTARDRLLVDISHELRGPLSRMAIALPLLRSHLPEAIAPGPEARYLGQLEHEGARMEALIEELLAFARGRSHEAIAQLPLDLAAIAHSLVAERQIVARDRSLALETALEPAPVTGDAALLERALGNLVDNALKYTPQGGHIRLQTRSVGSSSVFTVSDDGPGIPASELERVFEPFYRPDAARSRDTGGIGMGLAIARAIAERHGGAASLGSLPDQGVTAEIVLPSRFATRA